MFPANLKILFGVQRRGALDPRMNGVGSDDVELLFRRQDEVPGVVVDHLHPRVVHDVVIFLPEKWCDRPGNQRLEFADHDSLDTRIDNKRARGDAGAAADDQHRPEIRVKNPGMSPSIRCRRMSCGSVDASTLPLMWKLRTPSLISVTATEAFMPSPR